MIQGLFPPNMTSSRAYRQSGFIADTMTLGPYIIQKINLNYKSLIHDEIDEDGKTSIF